MSDKKHIDRLFQEKFKDFDFMPSDKVWDGIEARLQKKKKKRRVIPIWWQLGGVAAAVVLMFTIGNVFIGNDDTPIIVDSDSNKTEIKDNSLDKDSTLQKENSTIASENSTESNSNSNENNSSNNQQEAYSKSPFLKSNSSDNTYVVVQQNSTSTEKKFKDKTSIENRAQNYDKNTVAINLNKDANTNTTENKAQLKSKEEIDAILKPRRNTTDVIVKADTSFNETSDKDKTQSDEELEDALTKDNEGQDIEEAIAEANKTNEEEKELRRWSIAPNVAPVYFNSLGQGSSIDAQFNDNSSTSDITMSYGVKGSYNLSKRLKITAGVNRVNFNNTTNDIIAISDNNFAARSAVNNNNLENVKLGSAIDKASFMLMSRTSLIKASVPESINTLPNSNLEQNFGFIEIPLEVEYRVVDKKLGVNLSGGFSTLFLNENEIFADVNGENILIGEANNLNDTSFSANFGVGIDYSLTEKININLEPKFKYQLNTFNNTSGNFRPFFIGVYTGLSFKF